MSDKQQKKSFWVEDKWATVCYACQARFTWFLRRHHCRSCGQIFCKYCVADALGDPWGYKQTKVLICGQCLKRNQQAVRESSNAITEASPAMLHRTRPSALGSPVPSFAGTRASSLAPTVLGEPLGFGNTLGGVPGLRSGMTTVEPSPVNMRGGVAIGGLGTSSNAGWENSSFAGDDRYSSGAMTPRANSPPPLSPEPNHPNRNGNSPLPHTAAGRQLQEDLLRQFDGADAHHKAVTAGEVFPPRAPKVLQDFRKKQKEMNTSTGFNELNDNDFFTFGAGELSVTEPLPTPAQDWCSCIKKRAEEELSRQQPELTIHRPKRVYIPQPALSLKIVPSGAGPEIFGIPTYFRTADSMEIQLQCKARLEMMELQCSNHLTNFVHCAMVEAGLDPLENISREYLDRVHALIKSNSKTGSSGPGLLKVGSFAQLQSMINSGDGVGSEAGGRNQPTPSWKDSQPGSPKSDAGVDSMSGSLGLGTNLTAGAGHTPGNNTNKETGDSSDDEEDSAPLQDAVSPNARSGSSSHFTPSISIPRNYSGQRRSSMGQGSESGANPTPVDWCALLCEVAWKVIGTTMVDLHNIITNHVNVISCIQGGSYGDHEIIDGVMFFRNILYTSMKARIDQPRILLLAGEVDRDRLPGGRVTDDVLEYVNTYAGWLDKLYERIRVWRPTVIVVEQGIHHYLVDLVKKDDITLITHGERRTMDQLAHACGGRVVSLGHVSISELQDPSKTPVGTCDLFEVREIGDDTVSVFSGFGYRAYTTVVLRGGDVVFLEKMRGLLSRSLVCAHHLALQAHYLSDFKAVLAHGAYEPQNEQEARVIDESFNVGVFRSQQEIGLRIQDSWRPNSLQVNSIPLGKLGGLEPEGLDDEMPESPSHLMDDTMTNVSTITGTSAFSGPLNNGGFLTADQRRHHLLPKQPAHRDSKASPPPLGGAVLGAVLTGFSTWRKRSEYIYYTDNDSSLWEYLCERATEGNSVRVLVHGQFKLTVTTTVETVPARLLEDRLSSCAAKCRRCAEEGYDNVSFSPLTSGSMWLPASYHTLQLSFGAFLEMSFYCGAGCVGDCGHELHDMQRGFAFYPDETTHSIVIFEVDDLDTYEVRGPPVNYLTGVESCSYPSGGAAGSINGLENPDILALEAERASVSNTAICVGLSLPTLQARGLVLATAANDAKTHNQLAEVRCELRGFLVRAAEEAVQSGNRTAQNEIRDFRAHNAGYVPEINRFAELEDPSSIIYTALVATNTTTVNMVAAAAGGSIPSDSAAAAAMHRRSISMGFPVSPATQSPATATVRGKSVSGYSQVTGDLKQQLSLESSINNAANHFPISPTPSSTLTSPRNPYIDTHPIHSRTGSSVVGGSPTRGYKSPLPTDSLTPTRFTTKEPASDRGTPTLPVTLPTPPRTPVEPPADMLTASAPSSAASTPTDAGLEPREGDDNGRLGRRESGGKLGRRESITKKIKSALRSGNSTPTAEQKAADAEEQKEVEDEEDIIETMLGSAETDTREFSGTEEAINFLKNNQTTGQGSSLTAAKTWQREFELPDGNKKSLKVGILFPDHFAAVRYLYTKGHPDRLLSSLQRGEAFAPGGGKSLAKFFTTQDKRFILKEMQKPELVHFISTFGKSYFEHIVRVFEDPDNLGNMGGPGGAIKSALREDGLAPSLLCKIFGVFELTIKTGKRFQSTDSAPYIVMENLFCNTKIDRMYDLKGSQRNRMVSDSEFVQLDENFVRQANLGNLLYCREKTKSWLEATMSEDTALLSGKNIMDYSLIVGINEETRELTVGVIDYFRPYTLGKTAENWLKRQVDKVSNFGDSAATVREPTVTQPHNYRDRFLRWMRTYFCSVPCHEHQWGQDGGGHNQVIISHRLITSPKPGAGPSSTGNKSSKASTNTSMASGTRAQSRPVSSTVFMGPHSSLAMMQANQ